MRVPRHHRVDLIAGSFDEREGQVLYGDVEVAQEVDDEQPKVQGDLIVATAGGVKFARDVTN